MILIFYLITFKLLLNTFILFYNDMKLIFFKYFNFTKVSRAKINIYVNLEKKHNLHIINLAVYPSVQNWRIARVTSCKNDMASCTKTILHVYFTPGHKTKLMQQVFLKFIFMKIVMQISQCYSYYYILLTNIYKAISAKTKNCFTKMYLSIMASIEV